MKLTARRRFQLNWFPPRAKGRWRIPSQQDDFDVFLLMGQSNMAGFGCVREDDPWQPGDFDPVPGVFVFGGQSKIRSERVQGRLIWRPAAHPLHLNQNSCGFGLGLPFAQSLRQTNPGQSFGLIPCAWGGAAIDEINSGCPLFSNAVRRAKLAARGGRLRGVLWHQGESDTRRETLAKQHASKLRTFMKDLRSALGLPQLPFLIGDLAEFTQQEKSRRSSEAAAWNAEVRRGLRQVATEDAHAAFVESEGLGGVDEVHFGRESLIRFGRRYGEVWTRQFGGGSVSALCAPLRTTISTRQT